MRQAKIPRDHYQGKVAERSPLANLDQAVRRSNPTPVKKRMELLCQNACGPWPGAALAPAVSGTVVSANAGVPADFGLHRKPIWRGVAKTGLEHGRGAALARAIQMQ